jgi:hypothetical protein
MKRALLAACGLTLVTAFGAMAMVLAGPLTPIKFDVGGAASLLNPYFSQNWQLFAPDPVSDERGVVARLRCGGEATSWKDITSRAIVRTQASRFFPPRESRIVSNAVLQRFAQDDLTERLSEKHKAELAPPDPRVQLQAEEVLARYAALTVGCGRDDQQPTAVQLRYVTKPLPPWSQRGTAPPDAQPSFIDSRWIQL